MAQEAAQCTSGSFIRVYWALNTCYCSSVVLPSNRHSGNVIMERCIFEFFKSSFRSDPDCKLGEIIYSVLTLVVCKGNFANLPSSSKIPKYEVYLLI